MKTLTIVRTDQFNTITFKIQFFSDYSEIMFFKYSYDGAKFYREKKRKLFVTKKGVYFMFQKQRVYINQGE